MSENWFIARGEEQLGPFTVFELKEMGMAGKVEPTDHVWKEGMPNRVPATKVKGLLPTGDMPVSSDASAAPLAEQAATEAPPPQTPEQIAEERERAMRKRADFEVRPRRVTGIKGAIVLSQDGKEARIRKKCIRCGTEDNKRTALRILPGTSRTTFFCPNCRRVSPVEMSGV